jgi:hypothetical protein
LAYAFGRYSLVAENTIPCKIGDTVYAIRNYHSVKKGMCGKVSEMYYVGKEMQLCIVVKNIARGQWGKEVFPTYEEAMEKLKKDEKRS